MKFWTQTRKLKNNQDSEITYSIKGSWYLNKTNVDGKWYIFKYFNICFVIFSSLSVVCCIDDCPCWVYIQDYSGKPDFLIL